MGDHRQTLHVCYPDCLTFLNPTDASKPQPKPTHRRHVPADNCSAANAKPKTIPLKLKFKNEPKSKFDS
jgi:hypothetical protein